MNFELLGRHLAPAEAEYTVRVYHCSSFTSWLLNLNAYGYLTVTNKRVIFYAHGTSFSGRSVMHSEVPIEDVSGINTFKGTYLSIGRLLGALFVAFLVGGALGGIIGTVLSYIVTRLIIASDFSVNTTIVIPIILAIIGFVFLVFAESHSKDNIRRPIFGATGAFILAGSGGIGLAVGLAARLLGGTNNILGVALAILAFLAGLYALFSIFEYAKRETMSLTIGSKGGSYTPIVLSGISFLGIFNTAALSALNAEPAPETEAMIKELGALISDIQTLGELGLEKWKSK